MLKRYAAALLLAALALPGMAADLPTHPFIHVSAGASIGVMPDTGEIDFEVASSEPDPETAWKQVTERLEASRALFASHGIAPEDVTVQDIQRRPRKTEVAGDAPPQVDTRVAVKVTVRNMGSWTALVGSLMTMKQLESLAVSFSHTERDKIEAELVTQALANAKLKAQNVARGVGAKLGPATGVALGALKNLSNALGMAVDPMGRYSGDARTRGKPGDPTLVVAMTLAQNVDVVYRIGR
jgi:uncharacterized protein YggE